ncbi:hypothetical protein ECTW09195_5957, partial [Escherichia coli TW09195]
MEGGYYLFFKGGG